MYLYSEFINTLYPISKPTLMPDSIVEWQQIAWNPVTGCTPISTGCMHCYALPMAQRFQHNNNDKYVDGFKVTLHPELLLRRFNAIAKPSRIFVNSMSDLFHKDVPLDFIQQVFKVIVANPRHLFLVLTKRAEVMHQYRDELPWPRNLLMGVSVENADYKHRIRLLQETDAVNKCVFFEPLLGDIGEVDLTGIKWAFIGGESGMNFRNLNRDWIYSIKEQCDQQGCTFILKHFGGYPKEANGCLLDGIRYDNIPSVENCLETYTQGLLF